MSVYLQDGLILLDSGLVATSSDCCCECECSHDVLVSLHTTASITCGAHTLLIGDETRSHSFSASCSGDSYALCEDAVDLDCNDATACDVCFPTGHRCGVLSTAITKACTPGVRFQVSSEMGCSECQDTCDPDTCYSTRFFVTCNGNSGTDFPLGLPVGVTVLNYHCEDDFFDVNCSDLCHATMDIVATFTVS